MEFRDDFDEIIEIFTRETDKNAMAALFDDFFTAHEMEEFAKRWRLMKELYAGTSQRKIASDLHLSLCKITRGSKMLKKPGGQVKKLLDEYNKD